MIAPVWMHRAFRPLLVALAASAGVLGIGIGRLLAPPEAPPAYSGPKPATGTDRLVSHRESTLIDVPLERYLSWSRGTSLESILPASGSIPRVIGTEPVIGEWDHVGARRRIVLADGHFAAEEILANDRATMFRYQVWGYTNPARLMIAYAIGEFAYSEEDGKTRVIWTYSFHPTAGIVRPLLRRFVDGTWANYMRLVLETMRAEAEQYAGSAHVGDVTA
jgi:hypothetical protein